MLTFLMKTTYWLMNLSLFWEIVETIVLEVMNIINMVEFSRGGKRFDSERKSGQREKT